MNKAYNEALEMVDVLFDFPDTSPEQLMAIGYRAGLEEAKASFYQSVQAQTGNAGQILTVLHEKLEALSRKFEERAKELKI